MLSAMKLRRGYRNPAARLRAAVYALPRRSREAMLRAIEEEPIIAGAYSDAVSGGVCPMLAAHRHGGRAEPSSFARAWDCFVGARRPRPASGRELRALRSYLEISLIEDAGEAKRARPPHPGDAAGSAWILPARRYDTYRQRIADASAQRAGRTVGPIPDPRPARRRLQRVPDQSGASESAGRR